MRTNAAYFRERGSLDLERRIKEASLLFDEVVVEDGHYIATVGERSSVQMVQPVTEETGQDRSALTTSGGTFALAISDEETGASRTLINEPTNRRFVSEYRSITQKLLQEVRTTALPEWFTVAAYEPTPGMKSEISRMAREDARRPGFWRRTGSDQLRKVVLESLNHDLGLSTVLQMPASFDGYFAPLVRRKPGVRAMNSGSVVLHVVVPYFGNLSWPQIMELRDSPGIEDFRRKMREIQEEEIEGAVSQEDARERVHRRLQYDLAEAAQPARGWETAGKIGLHVTLGLISGGLATSAGALLDLREWDVRRRSWVTVYFHLRQLERQN